MPQTPEIPIKTIHLIPVLDSMLIDLLKSLSKDKWSRPTLARRWTVKGKGEFSKYYQWLETSSKLSVMT